MNKPALYTEQDIALALIFERATFHRDLTNSSADRPAFDVLAKLAHKALGKPSLKDFAWMKDDMESHAEFAELCHAAGINWPPKV